MRLIKTIILFILLVYSILFCVYNFQNTSFTIPFLVELDEVPQFLVIIGCLVIGIFIGSMISTAQGINTFFGRKSIFRENKLLKKKIDMYEAERNIHESLRIEDMENIE